jgi:short-subunit dehydrogenase involved in D-alanine esterification of teichoic acids
LVKALTKLACCPTTCRTKAGMHIASVDALQAFRTAISYRFVEWLNQNRDVFIAYKASLGFVWA